MSTPTLLAPFIDYSPEGTSSLNHGEKEATTSTTTEKKKKQKSSRDEVTFFVKGPQLIIDPRTWGKCCSTCI